VLGSGFELSTTKNKIKIKTMYITGGWCILVIQAFGSQRQEGCEFEVSLGYIVRHGLKKTPPTKNPIHVNVSQAYACWAPNYVPGAIIRVYID
jgi:hypothetical protein